MKKSKRYSRRSKRRQTKRRRINKKGGMFHENPDLPHYHLIVKVQCSGRESELNWPLFKRSEQSRGVPSDTVQTMKEIINGMRLIDASKPYTLIWHNKRFLPEMKIRDIGIQGDTSYYKLPLHTPNAGDPIYIVYDDEPYIMRDKKNKLLDENGNEIIVPVSELPIYETSETNSAPNTPR